MPEFNLQEMEEKFDDEFPAIEIPFEIIDEVDNDWVLADEEWEAILATYYTSKGESL